MGLTSSKATIKALDPFSLHSSGHSSMVLLSKVLEGDNYNTWSWAMRISLSAKEKIGFVIGSIKPPSSTNEPTLDLDTIVSPPPSTTHRYNCIKQPTVQLQNFYLYHTAKVASNQSFSL